MYKILYIISGRGINSKNVGRKISSIITCWRNLGFDVNAVFGDDISDQSASPEKKTSFARNCTPWYRNFPPLAPLINTLSERRDIRHNEQMIRHVRLVADVFRPHIIWQRSYKLHSAGLDVSKELGVPYVHEWVDHLIPYSISLYHSKAVNLERRKNLESDYIVAVSQAIKKNLTDEGIDPQKILVSYNAVDPEEFKPDDGLRQEFRCGLGIQPDDVLIGYLGSYAFYHDTARLILAADIVRKWRTTTGIKFLMVGSGKEYPKTYALAKKHGLLDTMIIMKPWVPKEDVPKILPALDIAVLPGTTDIICPIKIQEYMAMRLPVVLPDYACNREVITNSKTGMLFKPKNEQSLAETLMALANDSQMRTALGNNARQEVLNRFTWEQTWGRTLQEIMRRVSKPI